MKAKAILLSLITLICATLGLTACSVEASSPEQPEATAPSAEPDTSNEIQVQVLSEVHSSTTGPNINSTSVTTYYEYDETGRVVSTHQKTAPSSEVNQCEGSFEYDEEGMLVAITNYYEQYDWNMGNKTTLTYNDEGNCAHYDYEISQGSGRAECQYSYDNEGRVAGAVFTTYTTPADSGTTYNLSFTYLEDGHIESATSQETALGGMGFSLMESLSSPEEGVYAYRDVYDSITTLCFGPDGNLVSCEVAGTSSTQQDSFSYKTITVKADSFLPTVVSNPLGVDMRYIPQLSNKEIDRIKAK